VLLNQSGLGKGLHHNWPLSGGLDFDFVTVTLRDETGRRLARQLQFQLLDQQFDIWRRLCVARQDQASLIDRGVPDVDHFDFHRLLPASPKASTPGCAATAAALALLASNKRESDQDVSVSAMPQLLVDGTYAEFTLERSKDRLNPCQLHVACPQHAGISGGKIGAQQVVPVAPLRLLKLFLVDTKLEGLPRDLLAFLRYLQVHELSLAPPRKSWLPDFQRRAWPLLPLARSCDECLVERWLILHET